ncbi:TIGR00730 family Rossman fold protein [Chelativorans salis]|uniref:Cytokinin riboside 5'-monophosphate phosphoribohydrolase n=1 Tax=Chelativorans salis TaxID=2978478 RepID=A0ABT2LNE0_9HYPH|nr:TIGR00730 family Rossman fold protein [Chelativorans sp. EGI FJ00035]MCT7375962.1 TIGR00730 family Rossman fold protein [Chelativorans sp. EGI FJ00035]
MSTITSVCVYCGSSPGRDGSFLEAGRKLGNDLARAGLRLVYGAGATGIMNAVATGCLEEGGAVTGIIPRFLINKEAPGSSLDRLDDLILTDDMHQRKHIMFDRSDAFVALPGGIGTLEEIVEIMTWAQLGRHEKPIVFANFSGFWGPMLSLLSHMKAEGFIHSQERVRPLVIDRAEDIVPALTRTGAYSEGDPAIIGRL